MTIRHLKIFIAVADTGKMRAAAEQLYISQPSVSQAIRELEEYYDVKLFERLNQKIYITDSGKKLLPYARHLVASMDECEAVMKADRQHPVLRIGSSVSVGTTMLSGYLKSFQTEYPMVDIRVTVNNTAEIETLVLGNQLDLAIVEGSIDSSELHQLVVGEDELYLVVGKAHPFYHKPNITIDMLNGQALISREGGSVDRNQFEQFLREQNIRMEKKWSCTNVQAILNFVEEGYGIGILSGLLIKEELQNKKLKPLNVDGIHIKRKLKLIYHKNKFLTKELQAFLDLCRE